MIKVIKISPGLTIKEGLLECYIPEDMTQEELQKIDLLVETMLVGLKEIEKEYSDYMVIKTVFGGENHEN